MPKPKPVPERGGKALQRAIHIARARVGITSDMALSLAAPVSYDTLMNWYSNKTRPRGAELQKVAKVLDIPYATLEAAYEGRDPEPQPLHEAVADLTRAVRVLVAEIREDRERGQDAAAAMLRAAGVLGSLATSEGDTGSTAPVAPRGTRG
jgi:transcriptional regulator with XRE-family HTH domain